jgi:hypothetical protein
MRAVVVEIRAHGGARVPAETERLAIEAVVPAEGVGVALQAR